jgi:ABC-type multidrug transport system ATPase subunit
MNFVREVAKRHKVCTTQDKKGYRASLTIDQVLVIASIHQPSTTTFQLFDKLILMSRGKVTYNGPVANVGDYFASLGHEVCYSSLLQQHPKLT